jgi:hypothetical protein
MSNYPWLLISSSLLAGGCMFEHMDDSANLQADIASMRKEIQEHGALCAKADSMPGVMSELSRHEARMHEGLANMNATMSGIGSGCGSGMHGMMQTLHAMDEAMEGHRQRLEGMDDPNLAHQECAAHSQVMLGSCDDLARDGDDMDCM